MTKRGSGILWALVAVYWVFLFIVTHMPAQRLPQVGGGDKLHHFLGYAVLSAMLTVALWTTRQRAPIVIAIALCMTYAAVDEWLQLLVGRDCSVADWVADCCGAIVAAFILALLRIAARRRAASARPLPSS